MFSISFARKREKVVAIINIGSGSVSVAFGVLHQSHITLVTSATVEITLHDRTREHTTAAVLGALSEAVEKARAGYGVSSTLRTHGSPRIGYVVVESPWSRTCATKADKTLQEETHITKELIGELAGEAFSVISTPSVSNIAREHVIEATTVRVELNGYPTALPVGKHATHIAVHAIVSDAEPAIVRSASETLLSLGIEKPIYRSGARALFSATHTLPGIDQEYVLAHMTNGSLYFLAIRSGVPTSSATIFFGLREILQRVSSTQLPEEAISLFSLIGKDACSQEACAAFKERLAKFEPEFVRMIGEGLVELSGVRKLPLRLILYADPRVAGWLSNIFSRIDFEQFTVTAQPYVVQLFTPPTTLVAEANGVNSNSSVRIAAILALLETGVR